MAISLGAVNGPRFQTSNQLDISGRRIQTAPVRRGCPALGIAKKQNEHEL